MQLRAQMQLFEEAAAGKLASSALILHQHIQVNVFAQSF
jgi:hypothetical protein